MLLCLLFIKVNYSSCFDSVFASNMNLLFNHLSSKGYFVFHEQYSIFDKLWGVKCTFKSVSVPSRHWCFQTSLVFKGDPFSIKIGELKHNITDPLML